MSACNHALIIKRNLAILQYLAGLTTHKVNFGPDRLFTYLCLSLFYIMHVVHDIPVNINTFFV